MPDIRGAFAYVIAAAAAEGPSILHGVHHLERGYDQALAKFSELGLRITPPESAWRGRRRQARISTGTPMGRVSASRVMPSLLIRMHPLLTSDPSPDGSLVPWMPNWPSPPAKS